MASVIDMQHMRYLNLFEKVSRVRTRHCFLYNNTIFFCVPKPMIPKAIGERARNIRKLNEILGKKIKVVILPRGIEDARKFVESIVDPVTFKDLEVKEDEIIVSASTQSKAALIGRNKQRLEEMKKVISSFFGKNFKIV